MLVLMMMIVTAMMAESSKFRLYSRAHPPPQPPIHQIIHPLMHPKETYAGTNIRQLALMLLHTKEREKKKRNTRTQTRTNIHAQYTHQELTSHSSYSQALNLSL